MSSITQTAGPLCTYASFSDSLAPGVCPNAQLLIRTVVGNSVALAARDVIGEHVAHMCFE
jgi:hypothetical protein